MTAYGVTLEEGARQAWRPQPAAGNMECPGRFTPRASALPENVPAHPKRRVYSLDRALDLWRRREDLRGDRPLRSASRWSARLLVVHFGQQTIHGRSRGCDRYPSRGDRV